MPIQSVQAETRQQPRDPTKNESPKPKGFWERSVSDPSAFFTLVIAFFTIVLAGANIWLGLSTKKLWISAEDTKIFANRAWVFASPFSGSIKFKVDNLIGFEIIAYNYGNSPARIIELRYAIGDSPPDENENLCTQGCSAPFALAPGNRWTIVKDDTLVTHPFVFGYIRYIDLFKQIRLSRFCVVLSQNAPSNYLAAGSPYWSEFT